jgi:hypothetical protein
MWIAEFVLCTLTQGCTGIVFDDQTNFVTKNECEAYTEQKSNLIVKTMNEYEQIGKIYYDCKQKKGRVKT